MALPTGTPRPGGSGLTRSEAAIEAWKHRQRAAPKPGTLSPKIAARVKEILAAKQKKGKPKVAKGKAKAAKPKGTRQEIANQNRAAVAKQGGMGDLEGALVRVSAGMARGGKDLEPEAHDELIKKGLAKRHADGSLSLSPAGRKWKSAADKGDADAAGAALSEAQSGAADSAAKEQEKGTKKQERETAKADREKARGAKIAERAAKQKKQQRAAKQKAQARQKIATEKAKAKAAKEAAKLAKEKAKSAPATEVATSPQVTGKAIDMSDLAIKAGARHSRTDLQHIQAIHDSSVACGAACDTESADGADMPLDDEEEGVKAIKGIMDNPLYYAQHECQDIMQAANALSTMAMLISSELAEDDEDPAHIAMLCDAAHTLVDFIDSELDELESAGKDAAHDAGMGTMKAITAREDVNPKAGIAEYGKVDFADAKNKKYPIDTEAHVRAALSYFSKEENKAKYSAEDQKVIMAKIVSAYKKLIDKAGPPSAGKAIEIDDAFFAVKSIGDDGIMGPAIRYGTSDEPDMSDKRDYFTKSTNYYLDAWDKRPMLWHHAVPQVDLIDAMRKAGADPEEIKAMREAIIYLDANPVIGTWTKAVADPASVWMNGVLDRAHRYRAAIKRMVDLGMLKISTDSIPQMVRREKQSNGTNEVKCWPIVAASLTPQAAEPRLFDVQAIKSIYAEAGMEFPFELEDDPETKSDDDRARLISLELDLLELELTAS